MAGSAAVLQNERMEKHTTFRIGGPADLFVRPEHTEQIVQILHLCREAEVPYYVLGNGSNLLVSDKGYDGIVLRLSGEFANHEVSIPNCCSQSWRSWQKTPVWPGWNLPPGFPGQSAEQSP